MRHIDLLFNILTLLCGLTASLLGLLLYLKYRIKAIRYYTLFIFTTNFTVLATTLNTYFSAGGQTNAAIQTAGMLLFECFLALINYSFLRFALGILHREMKVRHIIHAGAPVGLIVLSLGMAALRPVQGEKLTTLLGLLFMGVLLALFLSFLVYSISIARNIKTLDNLNLQKALRLLARVVIVYIPLQTLVIVFLKDTFWIMLSRNLFYIAVDAVSILYAAIYFFIETPSVLTKIEVDAHVLEKYGITPREKEVMELLLAGLALKEIAGKLDRSYKTVNNHVYSIYRKTGVTSKMELLNLLQNAHIG